MSQRRGLLVFIAAAAVMAAALACSLPGMFVQQEPSPTPERPVSATPNGDIIIPPTVVRTATTVPPTATADTWSPSTTTPLPVAGSGQSASEQEAPTVVPSPTGPMKVIITDADIERSVESGAATGSGLDAQNVQVRTSGGKTQVTADRVAYGIMSVDNLVLVGRLVARDGQLQFDTESVSPGGLVGAMIPSLVNQAFKKYTSAYYVEDVQTEEGQVVLTVR